MAEGRGIGKNEVCFDMACEVFGGDGNLITFFSIAWFFCRVMVLFRVSARVVFFVLGC